jgi:hypothetical protein
VRFLDCEQPLGVAGELEKRDAFVQIGFVGVLMQFDLPLAAILLLGTFERRAPRSSKRVQRRFAPGIKLRAPPS